MKENGFVLAQSVVPGLLRESSFQRGPPHVRTAVVVQEERENCIGCRDRIILRDGHAGLPVNDLKNDLISRSIAVNGKVNDGEPPCGKTYLWR